MSDCLPRLRIAQIAPLWMPVPPPTYGGAEILVYWLTEELVRRGHEVTVFASGESTTSAELVTVCDTPLQAAMRKQAIYQYEPYAVSAMASAIGCGRDFDVLHAHVGPLGLAFADISPTPIVHTVHAGLDGVDEHWLLERHPRAIVAAISQSQVSTVPTERRLNIHTVYHGLDTVPYSPSLSTDGYVLFLGRMGPNKNPVGAIRIARAAGYPIVIAGLPQDRREQKYFDEQVAPLVDGDHVRHLGAVSQKDKVTLLQHADALIFPICWDEHFGLVMIEAMACGTPVLAFRRGSVPEVVEHGRTGFIGDNEADLVTALGQVETLDRAVVAARARERFTVARMADDYERLYRAAIGGRPETGPRR
jgi:glycosyltransferase involved in cell wall biosynthesis